MKWQMHEFKASERPPHSKLPDSRVTTNGTTFYDADIPAMTEIYQERCIDIFPDGRNYACQFLSVRDRTWLLKFKKSSQMTIDTCCLWRKDAFWAPRRDVIRTMKFDRHQDLKGRRTSWWVLSIPLPGPFGYGLHDDGTPAAFWFPVLSGWVQQEFSGFSTERPDPKVFQIPELCRQSHTTCEGDRAH
jgi:hypothetical protein